MKRVKVSALRSKRGLRPVEQVAEPPVVGLTAPTTMMTERTDTMKSYLLRNSKAVEPQNPRPALAPASARGPALFIGLDVHNDSIAVSIAHTNYHSALRDRRIKTGKIFSADPPDSTHCKSFHTAS